MEKPTSFKTKQLTMQEAFDKAAKGVITQGGPAMTSAGSCAYIVHLEDDTCLKCGVGHIIEDPEICERWDIKVWTIEDIMDRQLEDGSLLNEDPQVQEDLEAAGMRDLPLEFLNALQLAHDDATQKGGDWMEKWKIAMEEVAHKYELNPRALY